MLGTLPAVPVGQNSILVLLNFIKIFYECKIISAGLNAFEGTKAAVVSLSGKLPNLLLQGPVPLDCLFKLPSIPESQKPGAFNLRGNWFPSALEKSASKTPYQEQLEQASLGSDLVEKLRKMKNVAEKIPTAREIIQKHPASPAALFASVMLFEQAIKNWMMIV